MSVTSDSTLAEGATLEVEGGQAVIGRSPWQLFWLRFKRDKVAFVGLGFIVLLILIAVFAPVIGGLF